MKNNITEIVFILDRSGSMGGLESDTIGGFNSMLRKQKKEEGEAFVSTVLLFDHESVVLHDRLPIAQVPEMTDRDYTVRGCTALLDTIGDAVHHIKNIHKYARPEDVPEHTMFVITTDGMENASRRYSSSDIKKLIGNTAGNSSSSAPTSTLSRPRAATESARTERSITTPTKRVRRLFLRP